MNPAAAANASAVPVIRHAKQSPRLFPTSSELRRQPTRRRRFGNLGQAVRMMMAWAALALCVPGASQAQSDSPTDYLGIAGPIEFAGVQYRLAWSARIPPDYIKHEYLPVDQTLETFTDMVSVELLTSGMTLAEALKAQTDMLDMRKSSDPLVNYRTIWNPNNSQVVLDFLLSDANNGPPTLEWNAYRYVSVAMPDGKEAVILFAISRRHYGESGASDFLAALKTKRAADVDALIKHTVPGAEPVGKD